MLFVICFTALLALIVPIGFYVYREIHTVGDREMALRVFKGFWAGLGVGVIFLAVLILLAEIFWPDGFLFQVRELIVDALSQLDGPRSLI